jgi:guanylate kinase
MPVIKGKAVIISAPSGAGKSTISNYLLKKSNKLEFSISATTRKPGEWKKTGWNTIS